MSNLSNLTTLVRLSSFTSEEKRRIILKAFVNSQFRYFPFPWMSHNRTLSRMKRIHERALRTVYCYKISSFEELL